MCLTVGACSFYMQLQESWLSNSSTSVGSFRLRHKAWAPGFLAWPYRCVVWRNVRRRQVSKTMHFSGPVKSHHLLAVFFSYQGWMVRWHGKSCWNCWSFETSGVGRDADLLPCFGHACLRYNCIACDGCLPNVVFVLRSFFVSSCSHLVTEITHPIKLLYTLAYSRKKRYTTR